MWDSAEGPPRPGGRARRAGGGVAARPAGEVVRSWARRQRSEAARVDAVGARHQDGQGRDREHRHQPGGARVGAGAQRVARPRTQTASVQRCSRRHALTPIQRRT